MSDEDKQRRGYRSMGDGFDFRGKLKSLGEGAVIEDGVRILHPENVVVGVRSYIGHGAHLDGYHSGHIAIGDGSWIGQLAFLHGAGGLVIGVDVGIGPRALILTSQHDIARADLAVLHAPLSFAPVRIGAGADIGAGAIILPGVEIGELAVVGAGSVVTGNIPARAVAAGNPARVLRYLKT